MIKKLWIEYHQASSLRLLGQARRDRQSSLLVVSVPYRVDRRQIACPEGASAVDKNRRGSLAAVFLGEKIDPMGAEAEVSNIPCRTRNKSDLEGAEISRNPKIAARRRRQPSALWLGNLRAVVLDLGLARFLGPAVFSSSTWQ